MTVKFDGRAASFTAGEAIGQHVRVYLESDGTVMIAGVADPTLGTANRAASAAGELIGVDLVSKEGSIVCLAGGAITVGQFIEPAANGEVTGADTATAPIGIAGETAADATFVNVFLT